MSATGYTGAGGVEIYFEDKDGDAEKIWNAIFAASTAHGLKPIGLAARDTLRLEKGFCLYGNDIDETTNPVAAQLNFAIGKRRRLNWDFLGGQSVRAASENGSAEKLVGIRIDGRAPARAGAIIRAPETDQEIGRVTSGTFGPSVNAPIALGYVRSDFSMPGTEVNLIVRDKALPGIVSTLPFIPHHYVR